MKKKKKVSAHKLRDIRNKLKSMLEFLQQEGDKQPLPPSAAVFDSFIEQHEAGIKESRALTALMEVELSSVTYFQQTPEGQWEAFDQQVAEAYLFQNGLSDLRSYLAFKLQGQDRPSLALWFLGMNLLPGDLWTYVGVVAHSDGTQLALTVSDFAINLASLEETTEATLIGQAIEKANLEFDPTLTQSCALFAHPKICETVAQELKQPEALVRSILEAASEAPLTRNVIILGAVKAVSKHLPAIEQAMLLLMTAQKHMQDKNEEFDADIQQLSRECEGKLEAAKARFKQDLETQKNISASLSERAQRLSHELQNLRKQATVAQAVNEEPTPTAPKVSLGLRLDALF